MKNNSDKLATKVIHAGEPDPLISGAVSMPIFQTAMYEFKGEGDHEMLKYIRLNNTPNHIALNLKLAALENAESALVAGSGMAAISAALLSCLRSGDHLLAQDCLYGGAHTFITQVLPEYGIGYDFIDARHPDTWKTKIKSNTKVIYVESMTNPLLQVADLQAVVEFSKLNGLISMIDNTFASPVNFRPPEFGFDLSLHSGTKYLNGHSDIVAGAVIGKAELVERAALKLKLLGGALDPHACFLLHRGMKTLVLRMKQHNESGLKVAKFLENHPDIKNVNYPGLESNEGYFRAVKLFDGFSGMLSFEPKGGVVAAKKFMQNTTIPIIAPSLGGVETLLTRPATTSHSGLSTSDRKKLGISDHLIRVSIGIEDVDDIIYDFDQALKKSH